MVKKLFPQAADLEFPAGTEPCGQCEEQVGTYKDLCRKSTTSTTSTYGVDAFASFPLWHFVVRARGLLSICSA